MYLNKFDLVIDLRVLEPHFFKWKDVRFLKNKLRPGHINIYRSKILIFIENFQTDNATGWICKENEAIDKMINETKINKNK